MKDGGRRSCRSKERKEEREREREREEMGSRTCTFRAFFPWRVRHRCQTFFSPHTPLSFFGGYLLDLAPTTTSSGAGTAAAEGSDEGDTYHAPENPLALAFLLVPA